MILISFILEQDFIRNISYGTKDKMIILYDGPDKDTWNSNP